jgi:hypothetical protein
MFWAFGILDSVYWGALTGGSGVQPATRRKVKMMIEIPFFIIPFSGFYMKH